MFFVRSSSSDAISNPTEVHRCSTPSPDVALPGQGRNAHLAMLAADQGPLERASVYVRDQDLFWPGSLRSVLCHCTGVLIFATNRLHASRPAVPTSPNVISVSTQTDKSGIGLPVLDLKNIGRTLVSERLTDCWTLWFPGYWDIFISIPGLGLDLVVVWLSTIIFNTILWY